jgi:hypothetical protein
MSFSCRYRNKGSCGQLTPGALFIYSDLQNPNIQLTLKASNTWHPSQFAVDPEKLKRGFIRLIPLVAKDLRNMRFDVPP